MPSAHTEIKSSEASNGWILVANRSDFPTARPLLPIIIDDRPFILFKDDQGELGLIGRHCPHRGADLCYGRLEDNGIRCPFHGWHFDRTGQCVEQPAEPEGSVMYRAIKVPMIPLFEEGDDIFAFVGDGEPDNPSDQILSEARQ